MWWCWIIYNQPKCPWCWVMDVSFSFYSIRGWDKDVTEQWVFADISVVLCPSCFLKWHHWTQTLTCYCVKGSGVDCRALTKPCSDILDLKTWCFLTWELPVCSLDSSVQHTVGSLLNPAGGCYSGPGVSEQRTVNWGLKTELHSFSLIVYFHSA